MGWRMKNEEWGIWRMEAMERRKEGEWVKRDERKRRQKTVRETKRQSLVWSSVNKARASLFISCTYHRRSLFRVVSFGDADLLGSLFVFFPLTLVLSRHQLARHCTHAISWQGTHSLSFKPKGGGSGHFWRGMEIWKKMRALCLSHSLLCLSVCVFVRWTDWLTE